MANDLMRFSVAMPEDLLVSFDRLVSRRGLAKNRSEVVRDLVRDALVEDECAMPGVEVAGSLTIVFDHHASDLQEKLHSSSGSMRLNQVKEPDMPLSARMEIPRWML